VRAHPRGHRDAQWPDTVYAESEWPKLLLRDSPLLRPVSGTLRDGRPDKTRLSGALAVLASLGSLGRGRQAGGRVRAVRRVRGSSSGNRPMNPLWLEQSRTPGGAS